MEGLEGGLSESEKIGRRVEAALRKYDLGEPLTERETLIVYWVRHGGGCHACGGGANVAVRPRGG